MYAFQAVGGRFYAISSTQGHYTVFWSGIRDDGHDLKLACQGQGIWQIEGQPESGLLSQVRVYSLALM